MTHGNWVLLGLALAIFGVGLVNLFSSGGFRGEVGFSGNPFFQKQLISAFIGLGVMLAVVFPDYRKASGVAWPFYIVVLLLLIAVPIFGKKVLGAKRWLVLGGFSLQPSELAKIALLLVAAKVAAQSKDVFGWPHFLFLLLVGLVPAGLIIKQPDLGSGLIVLSVLGGVILFRGLTLSVWRVLLVLLPAIPFAAYNFLKDYQKKRILTFLNPENDPLGAGYHILQSQIAIGSGGVWGKGFRAGTQGQLRFLPEKHTDFAFAVFGEEWGFVGCAGLIALYCFMLMSIYATARDSKDKLGAYLCAGVFFYFFWQILVNVGMVLNLAPVVGIPLPLFSYGGSAAVVNFFMIGIVLNVSMRRFVFDERSKT